MKSGVAAVAWLLLQFPGWAAAHPVDEVVQSAYLTLAPGEVHMQLELTPGTEVVGALLQSLDANADQRIDDAEARAWAQRVLKQSNLSIDGVTAPWRFEKIDAPPYQSLKRQGDTLRIHAVASRAERAGAHVLKYANHYEPAKSQCIANVFLEAGEGWRYRIAHQQHSDDGRLLTVDYTGAVR